MIRLLWLFLILDVAVAGILMVAEWFAGVRIDHGDIIMRMLIEVAALAIIEAVRERKS